MKKPSSNFSIRITFRWINADSEDDWYAITADVVNNALTNKKLVNGAMTSQMTIILYYTDGVITIPPCATRGSYDLINYDPEETYFIESVAYASDIPSIPDDLINETTLTTTLNDYALKSDIPEAVDLSDYRKKDDLTVNITVDLPIEHKVPEEAYDFNGETAFVEFHEGAQLEGYVKVYDDEINDYVYEDFSITFHTSYIDDDWHYYRNAISEKVEGFFWNEKTNTFYAGGDVEFAVHLNSAKLVIEDNLVLKSEYDAKRSALEARIAALENA